MTPDEGDIMSGCTDTGSLRRREALQLLSPVQHHVQSTGAGFLLDHHESLSVAPAVVVWDRDAGAECIGLVEQEAWRTKRESGTGRHRHAHHLCPIPIDNLAAVGVP